MFRVCPFGSLNYDLVLAPKVVSRTRWEFLDREGFSITHNVRKEGVLLTGTAA